jgi:hypothetical protein
MWKHTFMFYVCDLMRANEKMKKKTEISALKGVNFFSKYKITIF